MITCTRIYHCEAKLVSVMRSRCRLEIRSGRRCNFACERYRFPDGEPVRLAGSGKSRWDRAAVSSIRASIRLSRCLHNSAGHISNCDLRNYYNLQPEYAH